MTTRVNRKELSDVVWKHPITALASKNAISDMGLRTVLLHANIPRPPTGYWTMNESKQAHLRKATSRYRATVASSSLPLRFIEESLIYGLGCFQIPWIAGSNEVRMHDQRMYSLPTLVVFPKGSQ